MHFQLDLQAPCFFLSPAGPKPPTLFLFNFFRPQTGHAFLPEFCRQAAAPASRRRGGRMSIADALEIKVRFVFLFNLLMGAVGA